MLWECVTKRCLPIIDNADQYLTSHKNFVCVVNLLGRIAKDSLMLYITIKSKEITIDLKSDEDLIQILSKMLTVDKTLMTLC